MNVIKQSFTFQFEEYVFSKGAQGISKVSQEVLIIIKTLQTQPEN